MQEVRELDALYESVPAFDKWLGCFVDEARWERHRTKLRELESKSPHLFERSRAVVKRATAIDTGSIDGLYAVGRNFTITVAINEAGWEAKLSEKTEATRALIDP